MSLPETINASLRGPFLMDDPKPGSSDPSRSQNPSQKSFPTLIDATGDTSDSRILHGKICEKMLTTFMMLLHYKHRLSNPV